MTFYHFANCVALGYVPYHLTYKIAGLSEYGAFWKCVTAGGLYFSCQLLKMLCLATFFPTDGTDWDALDSNPEGLLNVDPVAEYSIVTEFLKLSVDLADLFGLHLVLQRVAGKGQVKVLTAGLGWAFAEFIPTTLIYLWVGARGVEFDWKYIQRSFEANINLVHFLTLSCLIWLWTRRDVTKTLLPLLSGLVLACCYKGLLLDALVPFFGVGVWAALLYKAVVTGALGVIALQVYVGVTATDSY